MQQERKQTSTEVEKRLISTIQNWVESVFFPMLIERMKKSGIKEGSLTAKVVRTNLLQYEMWSSFTIQSSPTSSTAYLYDAEATLTSLWELTTPSGTVPRTIHFKVEAGICLADWEGVTDFKIVNLVVEGSDFLCTSLRRVVLRKVTPSDIRTQGKEAFSLLEFADYALHKIVHFILLHLLPPIYNFLSQKAMEIENAIIRTLATLPPLPLEFQDRVYTYKVKNVSRRAIKTFDSIVSVSKSSEHTEDKLEVIVEGVLEGNGMPREILFKIIVYVTLMEWRSRGGKVKMVGNVKIGVNWVWEGELLPPPPLVVYLYDVLEMKVENSKEGIEQFFTKVVEVINVEEIKKIIEKNKKKMRQEKDG